jgi:histidyl-tRNA synthetase
LIVCEQVGSLPAAAGALVYVVSAGEAGFEEAYKLARDLRNADISALCDLESRSMKAQLRQADKANVSYAAILGEDELAKGVVQIRDLAKGEQHEVPRTGVIEWLSR